MSIVINALPLVIFADQDSFYAICLDVVMILHAALCRYIFREHLLSFSVKILFEIVLNKQDFLYQGNCFGVNYFCQRIAV